MGGREGEREGWEGMWEGMWEGGREGGRVGRYVGGREGGKKKMHASNCSQSEWNLQTDYFCGSLLKSISRCTIVCVINHACSKWQIQDFFLFSRVYVQIGPLKE